MYSKLTTIFFFYVLVLLFAPVKRFSVSRMLNFYAANKNRVYILYKKLILISQILSFWLYMVGRKLQGNKKKANYPLLDGAEGGSLKVDKWVGKNP